MENMEEDTKEICQLCSKELKTRSALSSHMKIRHNADLEPLICEVCGKHFRITRVFECHKKSHERNYKKKCCLCEEVLQAMSQLHTHLKTKHEVTLSEERLEFPNFEEFKKWKEEIEASTMSNFVLHSGGNGNKEKVIRTYYCHRSGYFERKPGNKRSLKCVGSVKINSFCPAVMKLHLDTTGKATVHFVSTHLGHTCDLGLLRIPKSEKEEIAKKISNNIPFEEILDKIRDNLFDNSVGRVHLITKKDLHNITREYKLKDKVPKLRGVTKSEKESKSRKHKNDAKTVDAWVEEMKTELGIIRFYKAQGEIVEGCNLSLNDFCLILSNDRQLEVLNSFGNNVVCIDATQERNPYNFQMLTVLVLDELGEGFPCFFMISNRNDVVVLKFFFELIKKFANIQPRYLMTDVTDEYFCTWRAVFQNSTTRHLYSSWDVERAWDEALSQINEIKKAVLFEELRYILMESNVNKFNILSKNCLNKLASNDETLEFSKLFEGYLHKPETWANCYRCIKSDGIDLAGHINANLLDNLENMHKVLQLHLKGKRLDKGLDALMKFLRDRQYNRVVTTLKGKVNHKLAEVKKKHKDSEKMDPMSVIRTEDSWLVPSAKRKDEYYIIREFNKDCDCSLRCEECQACIHTYQCSCPDSAFKWNMCKHVHLLCKSEMGVKIEKENNDFVRETEQYGMMCESQIIEYDEFNPLSMQAIVTTSRVMEETPMAEDLLVSSEEELKTEVQTLLSQTLEMATQEEDWQLIKKHLSEAKKALEERKREILDSTPIEIVAQDDMFSVAKDSLKPNKIIQAFIPDNEDNIIVELIYT